MALNGGNLVTVDVKGLSELQDKLEQMPLKVAKKGVRAGLKSGADILRAMMIQLVDKDTGFLAEHLGTKFKMMRDEIAGSAFIGPKGKIEYPAYASGAYRIVRKISGKAKKVGRIAAATVARYLEFGTSKMSKKPFMTPAFDSTKEAVLTAITEKLRAAVFD